MNKINIMLEKLNNIDIGSKITIIKNNIFGDSIKLKCTYMKEPINSGWTKENFGSWSLYGDE